MAVNHRHAVALRRNADCGVVHNAVAFDASENFQRLLFTFFVFTFDERHDIVNNIPRRHARIASARHGLQGRNHKAGDGIARFHQRIDRRHVTLHAAIRFYRDKAIVPAAIFALNRDNVSMSSVDFGNHHRHVRRMAMRGIVRHHRQAVRSVAFF